MSHGDSVDGCFCVVPKLTEHGVEEALVEFETSCPRCLQRTTLKFSSLSTAGTYLIKEMKIDPTLL